MGVIKKSISKARLIALLFLFLCQVSLAQSPIEEQSEKHKKTISTAMTVLGTWAGINILGSGLASLNRKGSEKYFYQGNAYWNVVNLGLVGFSLYSLSNFPENPSANFLLEENLALQKLLLFNAGLDIAYIASGFYLRERSTNVESRRDMFKGFGNALILQGGFLLVFDSIFYLAMQNQESPILELLSTLQITPGNIAFTYRF